MIEIANFPTATHLFCPETAGKPAQRALQRYVLHGEENAPVCLILLAQLRGHGCGWLRGRACSDGGTALVANRSKPQLGNLSRRHRLLVCEPLGQRALVVLKLFFGHSLRDIVFQFLVADLFGLLRIGRIRLARVVQRVAFVRAVNVRYADTEIFLKGQLRANLVHCA